MTAAGSTTAPRALVVGGSTGVGSGIAAGLATAGYDVHVLSRSEPQRQHGRWVQADLGDREHTRRTLAELAEEPLAVLCFSAATYGAKRRNLVDTPQAEWTAQVDVMLHGLWESLHTCLPALTREPPGLVIGVSSEVVYNAGPGRSGYAAVKAAASAMLGSLRQEHDSNELRVVEVLPLGMVDSPGIRSRRPASFDYSDYLAPEAFMPVAAHLGRTRGGEDDGRALVVRADGSWSHATADQPPPSQSRAL